MPYHTNAMQVEVDNRQQDLPLVSSQIRRAVEVTLHFHGCSCDEVSVHLVDEAEICELHDQFFSDPSPTDCITIPIEPERQSDHWLLGEIFVCPAVAIRQAPEHNSDPYTETTLYIVHALLHLLGYDDIDEEDQLEMRQQETRTLDALSSHSAILQPSSQP